MSEEAQEYIKNNEFNLQFGGRGIAKQKYAKLQQENEYYKYILIEFEKWLVEKTKSTKLSLIEIITFKRCLEELQELKEDNNEKSND